MRLHRLMLALATSLVLAAHGVRRLKREHLHSNVGQLVTRGPLADAKLRKLGVTKAGLLGDVALTVVSGHATQQNGASVGTAGATRSAGENIYGPFEAGFGAQQHNVITGQLGCAIDTTLCYSEGGSDVTIAEKICAYNCNMTLPRTEGGTYYGFLDNCGGHTADYHYHKNLDCLYSSAAGSTHATKIAETKESSAVSGGSQPPPGGSGSSLCSDNSTPKCPDGSALRKTLPPCTGGKPVCDDGSEASPPGKRRRRLVSGQGIYGKWEDFSKSLLPTLDACNGHWGRTPDSPDKDVYHYHVTDHAPFTLGCYGPNDDNSHVSVQQCRDAYSECSETATLELFTVKDQNGVTTTFPYQPWCPCWDNSHAGPDGVGLNVGNVESSRAWKVRQYSGGAFRDTSTGSFASLSRYSIGISIVEREVNGTVPEKILTEELGSASRQDVLNPLSVLLSVCLASVLRFV